MPIINEKIENALAVFSFGQMQDFMTMHRVMSENDISIAELEGYVQNEIARPGAVVEGPQKQMPNCPTCGEQLAIQGICGKAKKKQNVNGWKSLWYCPAKDCTYEAYSRRIVADEIKALSNK